MILTDEQLAARRAGLMSVVKDRQIFTIERDYLDTIANLKRQLRERAFPSIDALRVLYEETADYIRINNLGDVHHNRSMQYARDVLAGDTRTLDMHDRSVILQPSGAFTPLVRELVLAPANCGVAGHFKFQENGGNCTMCQKITVLLLREREKAEAHDEEVRVRALEEAAKLAEPLEVAHHIRAMKRGSK